MPGQQPTVIHLRDHSMRFQRLSVLNTLIRPVAHARQNLVVKESKRRHQHQLAQGSDF